MIKMKILQRTLILCFLLLAIASAGAQSQEKPLRIFGYFQNSFQQWTAFQERPKQNSFSLQQLNLLLQKRLGTNWTAFVNFEFLNNFSSSRQWGSFNLEEVWVKYRADMRFNLKLGLLIPIFNNLHEIKNRTPLLPYIIRPLAYETSFSEFIQIEVLTPVRAFAQVYGFFPAGEAKFDYAVYVGNSPNINNDPSIDQTGIDTTATFLFGGRLGWRYGELKLGLSATYDKDNAAEVLAELNIPRSELSAIPKIRFGGDLSYNFANFSFESEFIKVSLDKDNPKLEQNLDFYYATLGYHFTEELFIYGSYWFLDAHTGKPALPNGRKEEDGNLKLATIGASYSMMDRVRLKAQFARVKLVNEEQLLPAGAFTKREDDFSIFALAVSVIF
ncbi:porin [candidate division KSB1 bacterium]|nr:porin [candidate division KSB1 bacterium]